MAASTESSSLRDLFTRLTSETTELFRKEIQLARAETSQSVSQALTAVIAILGGGFLGLAALILLLEALAHAIANATQLSLVTSGLLVGLVVAVIGGVMVWQGMNALKAANLMPNKTVRSVQRDAAMVQEHVR